ncbi:MAG: integrase [Archaeoglobaceae archaeon]
MAYGGLRLSNSVWMLNTFEKKKLEFKENFARYPFNLPYRTKKMFFAYMPIEFGKKLRKFSLVEGTIGVLDLPTVLFYPTNSENLHKNYLNLVELADEWYSKVVDKLSQLIPPL